MVGIGVCHEYSRDDPCSRKNQPSTTTFVGVALICAFAILLVIACFLAGIGELPEQASDESQRRKLEARLTQTPKPKSIIRAETKPPAATRGFFIDIGHSSKSVWSSPRSRHLEEKGWNGVCVFPLPADFSGRACKVIAQPVSAVSDEQVAVEDCWSREQGVQSFISVPFAKSTGCAVVEVRTISIESLLSKSAAPPVIDYVLLDTNGQEHTILSHFPFNDYCVRSWTVIHNGDVDKEKMFSMRHILEVAQGCRVRHVAEEYWARCPCEKKGSKKAVSLGAANEMAVV